MPHKPETIRLHDVEGIARLSGTDEYDGRWLQFEIDEYADQEPGTCDLCGAVLWSGWHCLDGGDEACDEHMEYERP